MFTHALGHVGKHIELGHEHQPTFALSPSALLKAGADRTVRHFLGDRIGQDVVER